MVQMPVSVAFHGVPHRVVRDAVLPGQLLYPDFCDDSSTMTHGIIGELDPSALLACVLELEALLAAIVRLICADLSRLAFCRR